MKFSYLTKLGVFGLKSVLFKWEKPILGTVIVTDFCNLDCKHCAVNNINKVMHSFETISFEMQKFYDEGIRILFLSGGETMLWKDGNKDIKDLIAKGREIGFYLINIVTNGTVHLNIPEADLVFLSLDGMKDVHNKIRGDVFDGIMKNVRKANNTNICVFTAINKVNQKEISSLCELVRSEPNLNSISFNFHTPYRLTEHLCLNTDERRAAVQEIKEMIKKGYPVFNLPSTLDIFLKNTWKRPCRQCVVSENGERFDCGRCSVIPGLCENCGYLFAVEFSTLFSGNIRAIFDMFRVYTRFV
ncbi:MAG: radical SAM protein [Spirochaetales bacterium]|nr:radical SAM protein [Spirochaetales bacterium]